MEESTTFVERFVENEARFPSFTLCPNDDSFYKKSIESFEDVAEEIENVKTNFIRKYYEFLPYEEAKIVNETYNQTLNNNWYFVPKTEDFFPYRTVICLITSLSNKHNPDKINTVSYSNCEICTFKLYHFILFSHTTILVHDRNEIFCIKTVSSTNSSRRKIPLCLQICRGRDQLDRE